MNFNVFLTIAEIAIPILHLIGLLLAGHAVMTGRTSQGTVAWALSLIFFPYVAVILYLVFGRQRFHGYIEARRRGERNIDHIAQALARRMSRFHAHFAPPAERFNVFTCLALFPFTAGNSARLLIDGRSTFDAIFAAIDAAKEYLYIQFFIIRNDALGRDLHERLVRKARAGVKVRLLFDEIGCIMLPKRYIASLREAGVDARPFDTRRGWANPLQINFRNHRKIMVVDGRVGYLGGHNVGMEYLGSDPRFGHWRDTHIEVSGPAVAAIEWSFLQDWHWATGEILPTPAPHPAETRQMDAAAIVIATGPAVAVSTCTLMFLAAIGAARKRVWITSPYFVPDETVYDALQLAAMRGVDVRILLPAKPDHLLVYLSSFSYLRSAEHVGVKFYRYQAGFLHQKVMLIDDDLGAVGTANLDNRSMRLNFEITVLFADQTVTARIADMLAHDFAHSCPTTEKDLDARGLPFRIGVRIARLFSPVQ